MKNQNTTRTADEYIQLIQSSASKTETIDLFNEACETYDIQLIQKVHKVVKELVIEAAMDEQCQENMAAREQKAREARIEEMKRLKVFDLDEWYLMQESGFIKEGDLVEIDFSEVIDRYESGRVTLKSMKPFLGVLSPTILPGQSLVWHRKNLLGSIFFIDNRLHFMPAGQAENCIDFGIKDMKARFCKIKVIQAA